jgi:hypothetical protein
VAAINPVRATTAVREQLLLATQAACLLAVAAQRRHCIQDSNIFTDFDQSSESPTTNSHSRRRIDE